jgi:hypothetical protein
MSSEKLEKIKAAIAALDDELGAYFASNPDKEEACELLVELNYIKGDVSYLYDKSSRAVGNLMDEADVVTLDSGASIQKKSAYTRKAWNHKGLTNAVAGKIVQMSVNMDTGEVFKSPYEIASEILTYCAPSYWRVTELNKIGINADNYCEVGELQTSIIVRKPKEL